MGSGLRASCTISIQQVRLQRTRIAILVVTFRSITIKALNGTEGDASDISMQSQMDAAGGREVEHPTLRVRGGGRARNRPRRATPGWG